MHRDVDKMPMLKRGKLGESWGTVCRERRCEGTRCDSEVSEV